MEWLSIVFTCTVILGICALTFGIIAGLQIKRRLRTQEKEIHSLNQEISSLLESHSLLKRAVGVEVFKLCSRSALLRERILARHPDLQKTAEYAKNIEVRGKSLLELLGLRQSLFSIPNSVNLRSSEKTETVEGLDEELSVQLRNGNS